MKDFQAHSRVQIGRVQAGHAQTGNAQAGHAVPRAVPGAVPGGPPGNVRLLIILGAIIGAAILLLTLLTRGSGEPVLLVILAILAMVGVFCLFGMAAGLIRFNDRSSDESGVAAHISDQLSEAIHITTVDGATIYANRSYQDLVGTNVAGQMGELETAFSNYPAAGEALFRLARIAERGRSGDEIFKIEIGKNASAGSASGALGAGVGAGNGAGSGAAADIDAAADTKYAAAAGKGVDIRWFRIAVTPLSADDPAGSGAANLMWKIVDVTDVQTSAAQTAMDYERELEVFQGLPVGLLTVSADGRIEKMNRTLAQWLGHPENSNADQFGKLADLTTNNDSSIIQTLCHSSDNDEGEFCSVDVEFVTEQSQILPVRLLAQGDLGALIGHDADWSDARGGRAPHQQITLVVQKRNELSEDDKLSDCNDIGLAKFFEKAPFGIATVDVGGRIISNNIPFARMFGAGRITKKSTIGKLLQKGVDSKIRQNILRSLEDVAGGQLDVAPVDICLGGRSEQTRRIFITPFRSSSSGDEVAILYVVDTTEQKALELQFAQSQKMEAVGKLAGGIAHDFNNVLTVIIGLSDLFLQTRRPTDAGYNDIMQIKTNAKRVAGTVRHLLAFSRKQTLSAEVMMLNDVVQDLGYTLSRLLGERVELKVHCQRDLWYVKADNSKFEQVVINLAVNARDAMPDGGRLAIRTKNITERDSLKLTDQGVVRGEYVLVEVKDTGTGMSKDVVEKIFEPFYTTKGVGKGTGLGLASVYGFVKQTGGYVFADSKLGKGSTFRVYLPRHQGDIHALEAAIAKNETVEPPRDLTGNGRVLLVEDEDGVRSFATRALKRQGYEVLEAASGVEALEVLEECGGSIDLVVSDVVMPEMDGPTLLKELRKTHKDLKFVFMSGYPDDAFAKTLDENESYGFLAKPFTLPQLAAKVKEELNS